MKPASKQQVKKKNQVASKKKKKTTKTTATSVKNTKVTTAKAAAGRKQALAKKKKVRRGRGRARYELYIRRLMKQCQPDCSISKRGLAVMHSLVDDVFRRVAAEAAVLTRHRKASTMTVADVEAAVGLLLPVRDGEIRQNVLTAGKKAVRLFKASSANKK